MKMLNEEKIFQLAKNNKKIYQSNTPFPNIYFEGFFEEKYLEEVLNEFPNLDINKKAIKFKDINQLKNASEGEELMGPKTKTLIHYLNSEPFLRFLSNLTGIENLLPDPTLSGGGYHEIKPGGFLKIHADFNKHPKYKLDRRLNLLIYLNKDWDKSYGGDFELWDKSMSTCVKKIPPIFNNVALFSTTSDSYHGHPNNLSCPPNRSRKSIALYYYTNGRPDSEKKKFLQDHTTIFKARDEDKNKKQIEGYINSKLKKERKNFFFLNLFKLIKLFLPPIFLKIIKRTKN